MENYGVDGYGMVALVLGVPSDMRIEFKRKLNRKMRWSTIVLLAI